MSVASTVMSRPLSCANPKRIYIFNMKLAHFPLARGSRTHHVGLVPDAVKHCKAFSTKVTRALTVLVNAHIQQS